MRSRDPQLRVFLSYRRQDASGHAGRLYDLLVARYGADRVFIDIDAVPLGSEFADAIGRAVASCDVLVALIGRGWLLATDSDGHRRLDDPDDFVRREIESALAQGVVVVPTCVQGAELPQPHDLPPSLTPLVARQGFQLSDTGWRDDVGRLIRRMEATKSDRTDQLAAAAARAAGNTGAAGRHRPRPSRRVLTIAALGLLALLAVVAAVIALRGGGNGGDRESVSSGASPGPQPSGVSQTAGIVTLGSDLRTPPSGERWYCSGSNADEPCTFALTALPEVDRPVKALFDGVVTSWKVEGAGGPIELVILHGEVKPGGPSSLARVRGSPEQEVRGEERHKFRTRLSIRKGDTVGLQLSVGAHGNAPYSTGASLEEWIPPLGPQTRPATNAEADSYELLYNASIEKDEDRDGFGDVTQDDCPKDPSRHKGC